MIFSVIEKYSMTPQFDDILNSYLLNNDKIRVDWLAKDSTKQCALEKLYVTINNQQPGNATADTSQPSTAVNTVANVLLLSDINHGELQQFWNTVGNTNSQHLLQLEAVGAPPLSIQNVLASDAITNIVHSLGRPRSDSSSTPHNTPKVVQRSNSSPFP